MHNRMQNNSGREEWHTPRWLAEVIRKFYAGQIDIDPATSLEANKIIKAKNTFRKGEYDLNKIRWKGTRGFINPPYNKTDEFSRKLLISLETEINQTWIWLSNNSTETQAIQRLMNSKFAKSLCLFNRRLAFEGPNAKFKIINGKIRYEQAMQGQILLLLTNNWLKEIQFSCRFHDYFKKYGSCFQKMTIWGAV